jgi:hypothetical protein
MIGGELEKSIIKGIVGAGCFMKINSWNGRIKRIIIAG